MTTTELAPETEAILSLAASLLDAAGSAPAAMVPPQVGLPCLLAAQLLERAGGRASRVSLIEGEIRPTIRAAMSTMARLDDDTFGTDDVLHAARAARRALNELG